MAAGGSSKVEEGCGNVFADLGLPDADELLVKAQLLWELRQVIEERSLTQTAAAQLMEVAQPDLSGLLRGRLRGFSVERLMRMLTALGRDLEIVVRPHGAQGEPGRVTVNRPREAVQSSAIASIGYEATAKMLDVEFVSGEVYRYSKVPEATYRAFQKADSIGTFFQAKIRDHFGFARVSSNRKATPKLTAGSPSSGRRARSAAGR